MLWQKGQSYFFTCIVFKFRNDHFDSKFFNSSYMCIYVCVQMYVHVYIRVYKHTHIPTHSATGVPQQLVIEPVDLHSV